MLKTNKYQLIRYSMTTAIVILSMAVRCSLVLAWNQDENQSSEQELVPIDPVLELEVREALSEDPSVESHELIVIVDGGEVYLYGSVDSGREKELAEKVASQVEGVISVNNQLTVATGPSLAGKKDPEIETSVRDALTKTLGQQAEEIEVFVEQGMATLKGTVETRSQLRKALETAFASGAVLVKNRLEVREGTKKPN